MHTRPYYTLIIICTVKYMHSYRKGRGAHFIICAYFTRVVIMCVASFFITCFTRKLNNTTKTKYIVILIIAQHINKYYRWFLKHNMHKYMCNMLSGFAFTLPAVHVSNKRCIQIFFKSTLMFCIYSYIF